MHADCGLSSSWTRFYTRPNPYLSQAAHSCKVHAKINRKMGNSTPCKIEIVTPKNFNVITSGRLSTMQILVLIGTVGLMPYRRNITTLNDVFPREKVPFGVRTMGDVIWVKYAPNTPPKNGSE